MQIRKEIAAKYWLQAAIEETATNYIERGYTIEKEAQIGNYRADLVARLGNEVVVIEFKTPSWSEWESKAAKELRNYVVHQLGGKFNLIWVEPPREISVLIEGLEDILMNELIENFPSKLDELSTHTTIDSVDDALIDSLEIVDGSIYVSGHATVSVELQFGSDSDLNADIGALGEDSFPFTFDIVLDTELNLTEVTKLDIETSDYYGDEDW